MTAPDPLAEALKPNPAQRTWMSITADISRDYHGWDIGYGLLGLVASDGTDTVSGSDETALRAAIGEVLMLRARRASR